MTQLPTDLDESAPDLSALMARAVDELSPPVDRLQHTAVAEGRRLRRRRQGVVVLGGVAAAAVLAVLVSPGDGGGAADRHLVATDPTAATSAVPSPPPTPASDEDGFWSMPSPEMRARLRTLLPDGVHLSDVELAPADRAPGQPATMAGWLNARLTRDGIAGESTIELMLWAPTRGGSTAAYQPSDASAAATTPASGPSDSDLISCPGNLVEPTTCTELLDHGVHMGRSSDVVDGALTQHEVTVTAGTGFVYVAVANTRDDKWGPDSVTSGAAPALTSDELLAIATAPTWADWTSAG